MPTIFRGAVFAIIGAFLLTRLAGVHSGGPPEISEATREEANARWSALVTCYNDDSAYAGCDIDPDTPGVQEATPTQWCAFYKWQRDNVPGEGGIGYRYSKCSEIDNSKEQK